MEQAQEFIIKNASKIDKSILLECYGLFKIITVGMCNIPEPSFFEFQKRAKWSAWSSLGNLDVEIAKEKYINIVQKLMENLNGTTNGTKNVSTNLNKTIDIFDLSKDGNLEELAKFKLDINFVDKDNMTILHWASDRGHINIVKYLIDIGFDCNLQDITGCSPLHHSAYAGKKNVYLFLLNTGAKPDIKNLNNETPETIFKNT